MTAQPRQKTDLRPARRHEEHVYLTVTGPTASIIRVSGRTGIHFDLDLDPDMNALQQALLSGISRCRTGSQIRLHTLDPDLMRLVRDKDTLDPEITRTLRKKDQLLSLARKEREIPIWRDLLAALQRKELPVPPPTVDYLLYTASFTDHSDVHAGAILAGHGSITVRSHSISGTDDVIQGEIDLTHWAMTQLGAHARLELHPAHGAALRLWDRPELLAKSDHHLHGERMRDIARLIQKHSLQYTVQAEHHPLLARHARAAAAFGYASGEVL